MKKHATPETTKEAIPAVIARVTDELYKAHAYFSKELFDGKLTTPVITLMPAGRKNALGWFRGDSWQIAGQRYSEINFCTEHLKRPFAELMETMIHEQVHQINSQSKIKDCSPQQRHNKKFKQAAELAGLAVEKMGRFGFAKTSLEGRSLAAVEKCPVDKGLFEIAREGISRRARGPKGREGIKRIAVDVSYDTKTLLDKCCNRSDPALAKCDVITEALGLYAEKHGVS